MPKTNILEFYRLRPLLHGANGEEIWPAAALAGAPDKVLVHLPLPSREKEAWQDYVGECLASA